MIALKENLDIYLAAFEELEKRRRSSDGVWLRDLRRRALERFLELGFPTTRVEEWKYTNVAPIARTCFQPAEPMAPAPVAEMLSRAPFADLQCPRLVFVNGRHAPELSCLRGLPQGVKAGSLASALKEEAAEQHLARYAAFHSQAFVALNTAFFQDGAFVQIAPEAVLESPLHLLFVSTAADPPLLTHPRNLLLVGPHSQATIIEGYLGPEGGAYFTNAVTELVVEEGATLEHYKLEQESEQAFHVATVQARQARHSNLLDHSVCLGGALVRNDTASLLDGEGGECTLNGLYVTRGQQHVDNHTVLDHAQPHSSSREYYKGVLDGYSTGVFNGGIVVRKAAQKTDAIQSNKNLLLSEHAAINTKPQLQIWADDVRCTHGATIGQLDAEAIFYLRTRGIALEQARRLLTFAFANDVINRMKVEAVRLRLEKALFDRLSLGATFRSPQGHGAG